MDIVRLTPGVPSKLACELGDLCDVGRWDAAASPRGSIDEGMIRSAASETVRGAHAFLAI